MGGVSGNTVVVFPIAFQVYIIRRAGAREKMNELEGQQGVYMDVVAVGLQRLRSAIKAEFGEP